MILCIYIKKVIVYVSKSKTNVYQFNSVVLKPPTQKLKFPQKKRKETKEKKENMET